MLKVDQYDYIRTAHRVYGKSIKQIARDTGHSKNTIKKILRGQYNGYAPRDSSPIRPWDLILVLSTDGLRRIKKIIQNSDTQQYGYFIAFSRNMSTQVRKSR